MDLQAQILAYLLAYLIFDELHNQSHLLTRPKYVSVLINMTAHVGLKIAYAVKPHGTMFAATAFYRGFREWTG